MTRSEGAVRFVAKFFTLLMSFLVGLVVIGFGVFWYVQRPLHEPSFFVQLTIDLVVNGEPVRIERKVECKTYIAGGRELSDLGTRPATRYAPSIGALGARLSDGSAVLMWTPYSCWQEEYQDSDGETRLRARPNAPDYLPLIAWTPDADDRRILEVYPFASYFERPDARVHVKTIEVTDLSVTTADPPDEFEWFTYTREREERGSGVNGIHVHWGQAVTMLNEAEWRGKSPDLDQELDSYDRPQFIPHKILPNGNWANIEAAQIFDEIYWGNWEKFIPRQPRGAVRIKHQNGPDRGPLLRDHDGARALAQDVFMLEWNGNALVLEPTDTWGYLVLKILSKGQPKSFLETSISFRGMQLDPDPFHPSWFFYDPETKVIFRIVNLGLNAQARRGDPIIEWARSTRKGS